MHREHAPAAALCFCQCPHTALWALICNALTSKRGRGGRITKKNRPRICPRFTSSLVTSTRAASLAIPVAWTRSTSPRGSRTDDRCVRAFSTVVPFFSFFLFKPFTLSASSFLRTSIPCRSGTSCPGRYFSPLDPHRGRQIFSGPQRSSLVPCPVSSKSCKPLRPRPSLHVPSSGFVFRFQGPSSS